MPASYDSFQQTFHDYGRVCVCVCVRERKRENERESEIEEGGWGERETGRSSSAVSQLVSEEGGGAGDAPRASAILPVALLSLNNRHGC